MENKKRYDTNPLDPDVAHRADDEWGATPQRGGANTDEMGGGATREIGYSQNEQARRDEGSEAPTRRYDNPPVTPQSYPSVFVPPTYSPPASYGAATTSAPHAGQYSVAHPPTSRTLPGLGLPENVAVILPYLPFPVLGGAAGAVELLLLPRTEVNARFHAAQGLALHLLVLAVGFLFRLADTIADNTVGGIFSLMLGIASVVFTIVAFIFFITSMIKVWKGEDHRVAPLADATRWLNEKIDPKK
ncbi:MAG: hypothetical protein WCF57_01820 [Pyrinomonadaceae bacterium]